MWDGLNPNYLNSMHGKKEKKFIEPLIKGLGL